MVLGPGESRPTMDDETRTALVYPATQSCWNLQGLHHTLYLCSPVVSNNFCSSCQLPTKVCLCSCLLYSWVESLWVAMARQDTGLGEQETHKVQAALP